MSTYDNNNIFAKILRGELPSEIVYDDDMTRVIMDIMPRTEGHALVMPKATSTNILDIALADLSACMLIVHKVALAAKDTFNADGITIQHFAESAGGQMVFHTHWHVLPRFNGRALKPHSSEVAPSSVIKETGARLRKALNSY